MCIRDRNAMSPEVVLIDFAIGQSTLQCAASIAEHAPQTAVVGFGAPSDLAALARQIGFQALVPAHGGGGAVRWGIHATPDSPAGGGGRRCAG